MKLFKRFVCFGFVLSMLLQGVLAEKPAVEQSEMPSRLRGEIERFGQDTGAFDRLWRSELSAARMARLSDLYADELATLLRMNFDSLNHDDQVDYILFRNHLEHEQHQMSQLKAEFAEMEPLIPFADDHRSRRCASPA